MTPKSVSFELKEIQEILDNNPDKILLLQDVNTKNISCSRCGRSGNNSNEIKHKDCCPYIGGDGC